MKFMSHAAMAALIGLGLSGGPASAATVTGDPVLYWNEVLITGLAGSPTVTSRGFAMVDVAMHDAVNATLGSPNHAYFGSVTTLGGDTRAAASVAARDVLVHLNPAKTADFDAALAASLALVPNGTAKTNGMATGAAIAAATIAGRAGDGSNLVVPYSPTGLPGDWAPTPPALAPAALPQWANVNPWLITSVSQFRPGAPPALNSAAYTAAFNEVKDIGAAASLTRTADQTASALFWAGAAGTGPWVRAAIDAAEGQGLSTLENAALFAQLTTSVADATIATWDAKYAYDYWRPITAIRGAGLDGNPDTFADPNWNSLIAAPPHPSYISAHGAVAGAAATVLGFKLGDSTPFCLTAGLNNRCWSGFGDAATDAMNSRLWGGIHWGFDDAAGLATGQQVAQFVLDQRAFAAVPEPSAWALMIVGFGLAGVAIRGRRAKTPGLASLSA